MNRCQIASLTLLATSLFPSLALGQPTESWLVQRAPAMLKTPLLFGVAGWQLLGVLLLVFVSVLLNRLALFLLASWLRALVGRVLPRLGAVVERAARPLSGLVIALVFLVGFPPLGFSETVTVVVGLASRVLAVASGVWFFYRQIDVIAGFLQDKAEATETKLDDQLVPLVRRTFKLFVVVIGGIFVLQNLNVDVASLVAGLGLGGLAFALAAKDTVANFFGAITIFVDRPFQIGDWVVIDKVEGTVEDVGFRTTRVRTFYNSLITIPNSKLTGTPVDNLGARVYRRIKCYIGLSYNTNSLKIQAFCEGVRAIIDAHPDTRKDYYHVYLNRIASSSLDVLLYFFVKTGTWSEELKAKHEIFLSILQLAERLEVAIAFPTQTVHVDSFPEKQPNHRPAAPDQPELAAQVLSFASDGKNSRPRQVELTHGFYATGDPMAREAGDTEEE